MDSKKSKAPQKPKKTSKRSFISKKEKKPAPKKKTKEAKPAINTAELEITMPDGKIEPRKYDCPTRPDGIKVTGRPPKYKDEYCEMIINWMRKTSHEIFVDESYYKIPDSVVKNIHDYTGDIPSAGPLKNTNHKIFAKTFPTFERFADSIGVCVDTLDERRTAKYPADRKVISLRGKLKYPKFSDAYRKAKQMQKSILIENALSGQYNPAFAKFMAINNFDMKDKIEFDGSSVTVPVGDLSDEKKKAILDRLNIM